MLIRKTPMLVFLLGVAIVGSAMALPTGHYTIQQAGNSRFVDAHESSGEDFNLVTRPPQNNDSQKWKITALGNERYTIQQLSNDRYVDAHENSAADFRVVTRPYQGNDSQRWIIFKSPVNGLYTIRQVSTGRYLDAYTSSSNDFRLVTRTAQNNDSQRWNIQLASRVTGLRFVHYGGDQRLIMTGIGFTPDRALSVFYENPRHGDQKIPNVIVDTDSNGAFDYDQTTHLNGIECDWYRMHFSNEFFMQKIRVEDSAGKTANFVTSTLQPCTWLP